MRSQPPGVLSPGVIVRDQHSTLAAGHGLDRMETEHRDVRPGVPTGAPHASAMRNPTTYTVAGIFYDDRTALPREACDARHIARLSGIVDSGNRFGVGLPRARQGHDIEVVGNGVNIREVRRRTHESSTIRRREKGVRSGDHT